MNADSDRGVMTQAAAGFENHLVPGRRPALVLVDLMRAYFEPGAQLWIGDDEPLRAAAQLLEAARRSSLPIIHTRVAYRPGGIDGGNFFKKVGALSALVGDSDLGRLMPEVAPADGEAVIVKQYASAFFATVLDSMLRTADVDTLIIAGVSTSGCVRATAVDAIQHGFVPLIVREAVGDRDPAPHQASLFDIQAKYGEVCSLTTALSYIAAQTSRK